MGSPPSLRRLSGCSGPLKAYYVRQLQFLLNLPHHAWLLLQLRLLFHVLVLMRLLKRGLVTANVGGVDLLDYDDGRRRRRRRLTRSRWRWRWKLILLLKWFLVLIFLLFLVGFLLTLLFGASTSAMVIGILLFRMLPVSELLMSWTHTSLIAALMHRLRRSSTCTTSGATGASCCATRCSSTRTSSI